MKATRAHVNYLKSEDESYNAEIELAYDFPDGLIAGKTGITALETIFRECNRVDGAEWISIARLKTRSLSVGDVVELDGKVYVCEGFGWKEITPAEGRWLIEKVTTRNFCHDMETTKELMEKLANLPK